MPKLNKTWFVQPHGPLSQISEGVFSAEGSITMPLGHFPRRMTVLALRHGGSAVWSAIPLAESEMAKIEALGPVRFIVVPSAHHRLDVAAWVKRYPAAQVMAPPAGRRGSARSGAGGGNKRHHARYIAASRTGAGPQGRRIRTHRASPGWRDAHSQ